MIRDDNKTRALDDGQAGFEKIAYNPGSALKIVFKA